MINPNELEEGGQPAMPRISNLVKASYTSSFRGMSNCLYSPVVPSRTVSRHLSSG
jgi:hypothetical protein